MSNAKKILEGKAKKLRVVQRVRRIRLDLNAMAPAYVSGSLQLQPKTRIVFASKEDGKIHEGTFFNTYQDALNVWDETPVTSLTSGHTSTTFVSMIVMN